MTVPLPIDDLQSMSTRIRRKFLTMHFQAHAGHVGGGLSTIEILTTLHWRWLRKQDHFILSKGHAVSALYAALWAKGRFSDELIATYYKDGTTLAAHPVALAHDEIYPATGSLGHGFPIAAGIAYTHQSLKKNDVQVACLMSDGECNEGTTWETALFASHHQLKNLLVVIDANGFQGFGSTASVLNMEPFRAKWEAFNFEVVVADGHDFKSLLAAFVLNDRPKCVICKTVKGKGVPAFENRMDSHYLPMTESQFQEAITLLDSQEVNS